MNDYRYALDNAAPPANDGHVHRNVLPRMDTRYRRDGSMRAMRDSPRVPEARPMIERLVNAIGYLSIGLMGALLAYGAYIY